MLVNCVAFLADVKKRYEERNLPQVSSLIKRGGTEVSPYFSNPSVIQFDLYPHSTDGLIPDA